MGIPMLKIRWSWVPFIFNMGIPILVRWHLYIETAHWPPLRSSGHPGCGLLRSLLAQPPICLPFELCHMGSLCRKSGNPHRSRKPTILCDWGNPNLYLPANHKRMMPANCGSCLMPHWQSHSHYSHQVRTVEQSTMLHFGVLKEKVIAGIYFFIFIVALGPIGHPRNQRQPVNWDLINNSKWKHRGWIIGVIHEHSDMCCTRSRCIFVEATPYAWVSVSNRTASSHGIEWRFNQNPASVIHESARENAVCKLMLFFRHHPVSIKVSKYHIHVMLSGTPSGPACANI